MVSLFVDTSHYLVVGLLTEKFEWIEYHQSKETKGSAHIHRMIYEQLQSHDLTFADIEIFFQVAGPGSYTGIRLSEGIAQILEMEKIRTYSFYHFDIPRYLGVPAGNWIVRAYKGEIFNYRWDENGQNETLMAENDSFNNLPDDILFSHYKGPIEDLQSQMGLEPTSQLIESSKMLYESSEKLFFKIVSFDIHNPPYYFRSLDNEFRRSGQPV